MSISILICSDEHKIYCTDFIRNHVLYSENQCHARLPSSSVILKTEMSWELFTIWQEKIVFGLLFIFEIERLCFRGTAVLNANLLRYIIKHYKHIAFQLNDYLHCFQTNSLLSLRQKNLSFLCEFLSKEHKTLLWMIRIVFQDHYRYP